MPTQENGIIIGVIITTFVFLIIGFFILILVAYTNRRKKKHIEEKQLMQTSFEQEMMRTQLEVQEQTMSTISQEIHDNIGQVLTLAKLNLSVYDSSASPELKEKMDTSRELVGRAIKDLRDLAKGLNTGYINELGLARALEYETEFIKKSVSFQTLFAISGTVQRLDQQRELVLFRMVQELINNAIKHAKAKKLSIQLDYQANQLSVQVSDDGDGFDLQTMDAAKSGLGIRNMRNRAKLINADLLMDSSPNHGTQIAIVVPYA